MAPDHGGAARPDDLPAAPPPVAGWGMLRAPAGRPAVVAHRGHSAVAPENTLAAVRRARVPGVDWIEVDVRCTADGVQLVIHDFSVDRTTDGTGVVAELTAAEVAPLDAGGWFDRRFAGEPVPTLEALLDDLSAAGGRLLLELKPPQRRDDVATIAAMLHKRGLADRVVLQSFRTELLELAAEVAPELPRALLTEDPLDDPVGACLRLGAIGYHPEYVDVLDDPGLVGRLHDAGLNILVWTVNDESAWPALAAAGVDGIITDRAADLAAWLER